MKKKYRIMIIIGLVLVALIIGVIYVFRDKGANEIVSEDELIQLVEESIEKINLENLSTVISSKTVDENILVLNFLDLSNEYVNERILELLEEYETKATFFVSGILAAEEEEFLEEANKAGHRIGSLGLDGSTGMEVQSEADLVNSFVRSRNIIETRIIDEKYTPLLYCKSTDYTKRILSTAYASGHEEMVANEAVLNYRSFTSLQQTKSYMNRLEPGTIVTVKLEGELTEQEYANWDDTPAIDKEEGTVNLEFDYIEEDRLLEVVEWILQGIKSKKSEVVLCHELPEYQKEDGEPIELEVDSTIGRTYSVTSKPSGNSSSNQKPSSNSKPESNSSLTTAQLAQLRKANNGKLALVSERIYTTQAAVNFSFYGVQNTVALDQVLDVLAQNNIIGTFFVSERDLTNYKTQISKVVLAGHELQLMLTDAVGTDFDSVAKTLHNMKATIKNVYGQEANYVTYPYIKEYDTEVLEAISASDCNVVTQELVVANSSIPRDATGQEIYNSIDHGGNISLKRGEIVFFRLEYYNSPTVIAEVVTMIKEKKVDNIAYIDNGVAKDPYTFSTIKGLSEGEGVYKYPVTTVNTAVAIDKGITFDIDELAARYVGSPFSINSDKLPGFTLEEIDKLDKTGVFTNEQKYFLSFDDWGSDAAVNKLLYVLRKHNVKVTFFVRTNYVQENPNLLRAIALEGHEIASHTDQHLTLANTVNENDDPDDDNTVFRELSTEQVQELKEDLVVSYEKLHSIVGDVVVNNKKMLTTMFRPPTLAVGKNGMEAVFNVGYTKIVSGDFSTHDYEATSVEEMIDTFINGRGNSSLQNGSVLVMHMSDEAKYIAAALDQVIPIFKQDGFSLEQLGNYLAQ